MKLRSVAGILVAGLVVALSAGCSGGTKAADKASATTPPSTAAATTQVATSASGDTGVPECDTYLKKYRECIEAKVPEAARAAVREGFEQTEAAWKQAAATPQGRAGLAQGCKQATDIARTAMQSYGCTF